MKLRNKKTGEIIELDLNVRISGYPNGIEFMKVSSLAELNEEWEDYKPKTNSRFRLVKDLPTFKAGEIFEIFDGNLYKINESDGDDTEYEVMAYHASTLKRFPNILKDWFEPIEPKEPLIKDEKIRKAVRAWAEANDYGNDEIYEFEDFWTSWRSWSLEHRGDDNEIHFNGGIDFDKMNHRGTYAIAELCGEEEE